MKKTIYAALMAFSMLPNISSAAGGGHEENKDASNNDTNNVYMKLDSLPTVRSPEVDHILDKVREKLASKYERDQHRKNIIIQEAERKARVDKRLESYFDSMASEKTIDHRTGSKPEGMSHSKNTSPNFVPISTSDLEVAFGNVGVDGAALNRDGHSLTIDFLCDSGNSAALSKSLPKDKSSEAHINEARRRLC